jgi:hypothetical protein
MTVIDALAIIDEALFDQPALSFEIRTALGEARRRRKPRKPTLARVPSRRARAGSKSPATKSSPTAPSSSSPANSKPLSRIRGSTISAARKPSDEAPEICAALGR